MHAYQQRNLSETTTQNNLHSNINIHITLLYYNQIDNTKITQEIYIFTPNHAEIA